MEAQTRQYGYSPSDAPPVRITVVKQGFEIITPLAQISDYPRQIESAGRTCYRSEKKITTNSADKFIRMLVKSGHHSVLEHCSISVRIISDRAMTHQLVRHRIAAYSQESQRYCDYVKRGLQVILPSSIGNLAPGTYIQKRGSWFGPLESNEDQGTSADNLVLAWLDGVASAYRTYQTLRKNKIRPEDARSILPNATKTEIVATYNLRQWRHLFEERALNRGAQSQIREITLQILKRFKQLLPAVFGDLLLDEKVI